jgi:hypothetical protein
MGMTAAPPIQESRRSVVGIATGYELDDRGVRVRVPVGLRIFTSQDRPDRLWVHPNSYPMGTGTLSPGVKRQGSEADHSPPTSVEVKRTWVYTSTPSYVFMAQCLISEFYLQCLISAFYLPSSTLEGRNNLERTHS